MKSAMEHGDYPLLTQVAAYADAAHAEDREDRVFAIGLERLLDGLIPQHKHDDHPLPS